MMRAIILAAGLMASFHPVRAAAADLTPLFPDGSWLVFGAELKAIQESKFGRTHFGKDSRLTAARKVFSALGHENGLSLFKTLSPLDTSLSRVERVTLAAPLDSARSADRVIFLEGDLGAVDLAAEVKAICKARGLNSDSSKAGERVIHTVLADPEIHFVRLNASTIVVGDSEKALVAVLERHAGKLKSKAPRAVIDGVKKIDPVATPLWMVVGENVVDKQVDYTRMIAAVSLGEDIALRITMETPDAAAAKRCTEHLELFKTLFRMSPKLRLASELGTSAKIGATGGTVTATAIITGKSFAKEYANGK